ncbi:CHAP domain-containing protein [Sphingomonas sp. RB3P16]|uniref:CHAP domain-containing protein n=1 Tax=Parasphingomonas frigoris TaxID=3096163 RepID=UPI002FC58FFC
MRIAFLSFALAAVLPTTVPAAAATSLLNYVGQCVPFARAASGIQIYGDAWTWWEKAAGHYQRGDLPRPGAVIVFERTTRLPMGHVAVISRVVDRQVVMVTHANWSRQNGERGHAEQDVTLTDVSTRGDWSAVKVWYRDMDGLGSTVYPTYGFIYGTALDNGQPAQPARELTGRAPDYVGALIDVYR